MLRTSLALFAIALPALAQHTTPHTDAAPKETSLPVTSVSLYKNGVGFFQHTGHITGNATVTLDFNSGQLNDVLQSLTAIDLNGGRIAGAGYNSTTPLDQQLKNLPIALGENPTAADFYAALRGARVEVHSGTASITGRLLAVEDRTPPAPENQPAPSPRQYITVVSDQGETRTLELTPATTVRLLDTALHTDVTRYLQLLDANRSQGLRHLTLTDNGVGPRELQLSYISEVPIWKSTYRILFTDRSTTPGAVTNPDGVAQTATLQGWSVVDNTTGADWINVHLSLIAGAPQSFIQPLSQPIYSRRPEVPIAQDPQLTPQTFDSSMDGLSSPTKLPKDIGMVREDVAPQPMARVMLGNSAMATSYGPGSGGNMGGGIMHVGGASTTTYEDAAIASTNLATTTTAFDDYFAYNLTEPVTILKNTSALVPILQTKLPTDRVTLISYANGRISQPLRALWLTNTSNLTLDRGSFSIVESGAPDGRSLSGGVQDGNFGGEGLLDPIHPGEKRLLSYAADQAVHATTEGDNTTNHVTFLRGSRGVLNIHRADFHELTLVLHNAASAQRTIVSEVPVVAGWKLDADTNPASTDPKPIETTPTVYRYRTALAPGATVRLHIGASRTSYTTYRLTNSDDNQLQFILTQSDNNPALVAALQPILEARRKVADAQAAVDQTSQHITALRVDEDRQRANITALANADKASRDRFVHDLNTTEDAINSAQAELTTRTAALDAAKGDLAARIDAFSIDTQPH
jgi:hypothetical protein